MGKAIDQTTIAAIAAQPLPPCVIAILDNGGIKPMIRKQTGLPRHKRMT